MALQAKLQLYTGLLKSLINAVSSPPGLLAYTSDSQGLYVSNGDSYVRVSSETKVWTVATTADLQTAGTAADGNALPGDVVLVSATGSTFLLTSFANKIWQASTNYSLGDSIIDSNGNLQTVTVAGESGTIEPNWSPSPPSPTIIDNTVTWTVGSGFVKIADLPGSSSVSSINGIGPDGSGNVALTLGDLLDVLISDPSNGDILTYDRSSSEWINSSPPVSSLADLSDVDLTSPESGQLLSFNGSEWVNSDLPIATDSTLGVVEPDGTTIVISDGVITAVGESIFPPEAANLVLAGPVSGFAAIPTFRALISTDLPPATSGLLGAVQPDGTTITVFSDGIISGIAGALPN